MLSCLEVCPSLFPQKLFQTLLHWVWPPLGSKPLSLLYAKLQILQDSSCALAQRMVQEFYPGKISDSNGLWMLLKFPKTTQIQWVAVKSMILKSLSLDVKASSNFPTPEGLVWDDSSVTPIFPGDRCCATTPCAGR